MLEMYGIHRILSNCDTYMNLAYLGSWKSYAVDACTGKPIPEIQHSSNVWEGYINGNLHPC